MASKLSPFLTVGLLDQLGVVDGADIFQVGGDTAKPEVERPSGVDVTQKDTASPGGVFARFTGASTQNQVLTVTAVVVGVIGLFALARTF